MDDPLITSNDNAVAGTLEIQENATLTIDVPGGGINNKLTVQGDVVLNGTLENNGSFYALQGIFLNGTGKINNGTNNSDAYCEVQAPSGFGMLTQTGSATNNYGELNFTNLSGFSGLLLAGGLLHNHAGATLDINNSTGGVPFFASGSSTAINDGDIVFSAIGGSPPEVMSCGGGDPSTFTNNGTIQIKDVPNGSMAFRVFEGATFENNSMTEIGQNGGTGGDGMLIQGNGNGTGVQNAGTIIIGNTNGPAITNNFQFNNTSGTLKVDGEVSGLGNLAGTLAPGNSTGTVSVTDNIDFSNATVEIEVNGPADFDAISVVNTVTLGGTLNTIINYTPTANDRIVFLTATSVVGTFTVNPALPADWTVDYSVSGEVALQFSGILPVELVDFFRCKK